PPILLQTLVYGPLCLAAAAFSAWLEGTGGLAAKTAWFFAAGMAVTGVTAALGLMMFQLFAQPERFGAPSGAALWRFRAVGLSAGPSMGLSAGLCGLQALLPPETRGRVLRMSAENQYVRITTVAGETLLRCTLSEAAERVPQGEGLRVHRSHWLAFDQVAELGYRRGNLQATTRDGRIVPIGRAQSKVLKARLRERTPMS
ncbi:MAG: LytTR family DNA-binding domain-containing protein, partial [Pseudomonadota bacterium]